MTNGTGIKIVPVPVQTANIFDFFGDFLIFEKFVKVPGTVVEPD
jgi:hypothetical protein